MEPVPHPPPPIAVFYTSLIIVGPLIFHTRAHGEILEYQ
jgi:hypothetical protein